MEHLFETTRERIARILRETEKPLTVDEIINMLEDRSIKSQDIYEHLEHVAKSIYIKTRGNEILVMEPPVCRKCGYVFKELNKPKKPGKCPRCKSEWISSPRFMIIKRNEEKK
ncbi:MAG: transcriptional regulator [Desulfurococcaceae archaeon]